jgi:hypothetical protein
VRVSNRHVIYVQRYEPRGLAQYYRMFRTELRKFSGLYQLAATISGRTAAAMTRSPPGRSRPVRRQRAGLAQPHRLRFLRFDDFIQSDRAAPIWRTVLQAVWISWRPILRGTIGSPRMASKAGAGKRNPAIMAVRFREIIKSEDYNLFRRRSSGCTSMANERPHPYNFCAVRCPCPNGWLIPMRRWRRHRN